MAPAGKLARSAFKYSRFILQADPPAPFSIGDHAVQLGYHALIVLNEAVTFAFEATRGRHVPDVHLAVLEPLKPLLALRPLALQSPNKIVYPRHFRMPRCTLLS